MGEIAEDIINGFQCSWCGICFEEEHGYPVLCDDCFEEQEKGEHFNELIPKHIYPEL